MTTTQIINRLARRANIVSTESVTFEWTAHKSQRVSKTDGVSTWEVILPDFGNGARKVIATIPTYTHDSALERAAVIKAICG